MKGAKLSRLVREHIEKNYGGYVINVIVASRNGTADLIACIEGKFFAFEVKGNKDRPSLVQNDKMRKVRHSGGYGGYVRSVQEADDIIKTRARPKLVQPPTSLSL